MAAAFTAACRHPPRRRCIPTCTSSLPPADRTDSDSASSCGDMLCTSAASLRAGVGVHVGVGGSGGGVAWVGWGGRRGCTLATPPGNPPSKQAGAMDGCMHRWHTLVSTSKPSTKNSREPCARGSEEARTKPQAHRSAVTCTRCTPNRVSQTASPPGGVEKAASSNSCTVWPREIQPRAPPFLRRHMGASGPCHGGEAWHGCHDREVHT